MSKNQEETKEVEFQEFPRICLFDVGDNTVQTLKSSGFNCSTGTRGVEVVLPDNVNGNCCLPNGYWPPNLHEHSVLVIDFAGNKNRIDFDPSDHDFRKQAGKIKECYYCHAHERYFDPRSLGSSMLGDILEDSFNSFYIIVCFADSQRAVEYLCATIDNRGFNPKDFYNLHNFSIFYHSCWVKQNISGDITTPLKNTPFHDFLQKYNAKFKYEVGFKHPTILQNGKYIQDDNFSPLILNGGGDIISYYYCDQSYALLMFPQLEDKSGFLRELFSSILPAIHPKIFPFSSEFKWLENEKYLLPNELGLMFEKREIELKYVEEVDKIDQRTTQNRIQFKFLHDLLTQTGDELVRSAIDFLSWLGFENVIDCDDSEKSLKEEDIQITTDKETLLIEVKGIGGTSTDKDCSQISKYVNRKRKEMNNFEVYGLYLVNHQRYLPPEERNNPPFSAEQIKDAENEERGLLTTYDLFKLYYLIEDGLILKEDARKNLLKHGCIEFALSNFTFLAQVKETHHSGAVVIFDLKDQLIAKGDILVFEKNKQFTKTQIKCIKVDGVQQTEVSSGEVGVELDKKVPDKSEVWLAI